MHIFGSKAWIVSVRTNILQQHWQVFSTYNTYQTCIRTREQSIVQEEWSAMSNECISFHFSKSDTSCAFSTFNRLMGQLVNRSCCSHLAIQSIKLETNNHWSLNQRHRRWFNVATTWCAQWEPLTAIFIFSNSWSVWYWSTRVYDLPVKGTCPSLKSLKNRCFILAF